MKLQRITELDGPPVIGEAYLVPTVIYPWTPGFTRQQRRRFPRTPGESFALQGQAWPVLGGLHEDRDHLGFPDLHYHVDPRFLRPSEFRRVEAYADNRGWSTAVVFEGTPLSLNTWSSGPKAVRSVVPHQGIVWARRVCHRPLHGPHRVRELGVKLDPIYAGKVCKRGKGGLICPHRGYTLGGVEPVDGVITCPLHGLRIDAASGTVLPTPEPPPTPRLRTALAALEATS